MDTSHIFFILHSPALSPAVAAFAVLAAALFLFPGGLAWAISRAPPAIPGPPGSFLAPSGAAAHRRLAATARSLGATRLMAFSFGRTRFVVASDPETAKQILSGPAFADRPIKESAAELLFGRAMGFAPSGEYWRNLRRISSAYLFSPRRVASFEKRRRAVGDAVVGEVRKSMERDGVVDAKKLLRFASLNIIMATVFGKCYDFGEDEGLALELLVKEGYGLLGEFNWSDHLPLLGWLDLQGVRRRCRALAVRVNEFVGKIIEERRGSGGGGRVEDGGDFVDVLLHLEEKESFSESDMVAVLWVRYFLTNHNLVACILIGLLYIYIKMNVLS